MWKSLALCILAGSVTACHRSSGTTGDASIDGVHAVCGNSIVEGNEDCDDGANNGVVGDPCDSTCHWVCLGDNYCNDLNPCNGMETCVAHVCVAGTSLPDGTTCGASQICLNSACTMDVCGDGFVAPPEECDDGNLISGDGCENNCKFSCVSTDATRNCTPTDACAGQGTCNDTTHVCAAGTPLTNNTPCGTGGYCRTGVCTQPVCGNGIVELGEQCDDGASNGTVGDGCKSNCQFACVTPATDCGAPPKCEKETCTATHACLAVADTTLNNTSCGTGLVCQNGACLPPTSVCGNGIVETGEQCDFGTGNGPGTGCESNCTFSCTKLPNSCDDGNPCNGVEACNTVTVLGHTGQKCFAGTPPATGTTCGTGKICLASVCATSICGDGYVDPLRGETCELPNTSTCDSMCHLIVCGDGVRAGTEQCDDGNTINLDGCSSTCKFEQDHRVNSLSMPFNTDTYCTKNALGGAFVGGTAQNNVTSALSGGVNNGSITVMFAALGLTDLTGTSDPAFNVGLLNGTQATSTATTYNGASDLDWWYTTAASSIDGTRTPTNVVPASITAKVLTAGPAEMLLTINLGGMPATLDLLAAHLRANIGATSSPLASTNGMTPGHLPAENLDPALVSFATSSAGELCGNVTAQSLANVLAPSALVGCGFLSCSQCYTATSTVLDIIVGGCNTIIGNQINGTQPDTGRVTTDVYRFTENAQHVVTACTKNGVADTLSDCLANAAYTSFLKFTTDRVIAK